MDDCGNGAPDILLVGALKGCEYELATRLPPHNQAAFAWANSPVYDGKITVEHTMIVPIVSTDAEKIGAAGVFDEQLIEA